MEKIKRYKGYGHTEEDKNGSWVKYEDVKPILENYYKLLNRMVIDDEGIHFTPYEWPEMKPEKIKITYSEKPKQKKCNCEEKAKEAISNLARLSHIKDLENGYAIGPLEDWWVCPEHGYKRR